MMNDEKLKPILTIQKRYFTEDGYPRKRYIGKKSILQEAVNVAVDNDWSLADIDKLIKKCGSCKRVTGVRKILSERFDIVLV